MGKAFKGRKKKYKDPYRLQSLQLSKIAHKINRAPANDEIQEIPKRLRFIVDYQEKLKNEPQPDPKDKKISNKQLKKMKAKSKADNGLIDTANIASRATVLPGMERPLHMIPHLKQYPDEDDEQFLRRVNIATVNMLKESDFEDKYKVDVERLGTGGVRSVKARKLLDDPALTDKQRSQLESREKIKKEKKKERDLKRKTRNRKKEEDVDEFSYFKDEVKFGEVVYEPPSLDTSRFTKLMGGVTKSKSFLFLEKLKGAQAGKLPELTAARKRTLEDERLKAVQAYRDMKAAKYKANNKNLAFV